ncbi:MAG: hypothetical protein DHS20C17_10930 [Cyclobacteriaceae bacterium]|nr:MAG: hypothetical protein DHS20C17_10930 [Cyclobacteriaceae bacterium]
MSHFTEEHIFKYLDQELSAEQVKAFEEQLKTDPQLKATVEQLKYANQTFHSNRLEKAPDHLSDKILMEISDSSRKGYYRPNGLSSSSGFLLITGCLTALVTLLSVVNGGYIDLQSFMPTAVFETSLTNSNQFLSNLISDKALINSMMVIYGGLALVLLDRFVLNPLFRKRAKHLGYN